MNQDQLLSLLRTVLKIVGALLVAHGTAGINGAMWEQISGGVIMIAPVVWDMFVHTDAGKLAAVAAMPDVKNIVVKVSATDGVAAAAADPTQPKIISTVMAKTAAVLAILILGT